MVRPKCNSRPPAWQPGAQPTETPVRGLINFCLRFPNTYNLLELNTDLKMSSLSLKKNMFDYSKL